MLYVLFYACTNTIGTALDDCIQLTVCA